MFRQELIVWMTLVITVMMLIVSVIENHCNDFYFELPGHVSPRSLICAKRPRETKRLSEFKAKPLLPK